MRTVHETGHALATLDDGGIATLQLRDAGKLNIVGSAQITQLAEARRCACWCCAAKASAPSSAAPTSARWPR
jgi:hypothetical protein